MEEIKEKPYVEPGGEAYGSLRWSAFVWHDGTVKNIKLGLTEYKTGIIIHINLIGKTGKV